MSSRRRMMLVCGALRLRGERREKPAPAASLAPRLGLSSFSPMADSFIHLHVHTEYSTLDGANRIPDILKKAKKFGMPALALTDHGVLYGAIEFFQQAKKIGVK